jgi:hypothetical protein
MFLLGPGSILGSILFLRELGADLSFSPVFSISRFFTICDFCLSLEFWFSSGPCRSPTACYHSIFPHVYDLVSLLAAKARGLDLDRFSIPARCFYVRWSAARSKIFSSRHGFPARTPFRSPALLSPSPVRSSLF